MESEPVKEMKRIVIVLYGVRVKNLEICIYHCKTTCIMVKDLDLSSNPGSSLH